MYRVLLHRNAAKVYEKLDEKTVARINKNIDSLKGNPFYGKDIKRLRGELQGRYRLRVGGYRIIYRVDEGEKAVIIEDIGLRGNVY
ncbi:MAG: ParE toxin of type II toxin-antitoxin system, parDE [Candidatus Argoarchaeum ethanivorans]|uniref:ParE toxin of type II toxin-antitoxin system, parDE n=1 Tax=Candidatus Argoarchaeum ethanivorans TaxID=2608793 RepID=A0A811T4L6_9EURY|nr:MAG: ParE toxin of type II toxin-antitoxin system, parDE [Candidatus Argoarchaeum ethanivorans]CAD6491612.1 MAG: ParE toxin of type II toxin-antitoxin system, parDE [Candidatus Argoarchaeum ethanivorans]